MSAVRMRRCFSALGILLLGSAPAAAQGCLETPVPAAGWAGQVRMLYAPETDPEFEGEVVASAGTGVEAAVARDFHGSSAAALSAAATDYDIITLVYDPETEDFRRETLAVANVHLAGRLSFDLYGSAPICPFVEAGGFRARADRVEGQDVTREATGFYAGAGWTLEPRWRLTEAAPGAGPGVEASAFLTTRLLVIGAGRTSADGYDDGSELLPKLAFRIGGTLSVSYFFVGLDAGFFFPAADPDFWLRHNSADERRATTFGLRAGVLF